MTTLPCNTKQGYTFVYEPLPCPPLTLLELILLVKELRRIVGEGQGCDCGGASHLACAIRKALDDNKAVHDLNL